MYDQIIFDEYKETWVGFKENKDNVLCFVKLKVAFKNTIL